MNFPTLQQVRSRGHITSSVIRRQYTLTETEEAKIDALLLNKKSILHLDTPQSYERALLLLDSIFGKFIETRDNKVILRGKLEFKEEAKNVETGEQEYIYTISDPKSLYRKRDSTPFLIGIPAKANILSGIYAQITAKPNPRNNLPYIFVESDI